MRHCVEIKRPDEVILLSGLRTPIEIGELNIIFLLDKHIPCIAARVDVDTKKTKGKQSRYVIMGLEKASFIISEPNDLKSVLDNIKGLTEKGRISNIETYSSMDDLMGYLDDWENA